MTQDTLDIEVFQEAGLSFEEIESVKRGLDDVKQGRVVDEQMFYSRLEKRLFSENKSYV